MAEPSRLSVKAKIGKDNWTRPARALEWARAWIVGEQLHPRSGVVERHLSPPGGRDSPARGGPGRGSVVSTPPA